MGQNLIRSMHKDAAGTWGAIIKQADSAAHTERGSQGRQTSEKSIVSG